MPCDCECSLALPYGGVGWSTVCECGVSTFLLTHLIRVAGLSLTIGEGTVLCVPLYFELMGFYCLYVFYGMILCFDVVISGWKILQSDCYYFVNVSMTWHDASQACHR